MANKSIKELPTATQIQEDDALPMQQGTVTKQVTGLTMTLWLLAMADGHGGIRAIEKTSTSGLVDTYTITLADTTTFAFTVTNGKSITSIVKTGTSGLVDTYTINYNNGSPTKFTVTNGEKGDKGNNAYVWVKWASEKPTSSGVTLSDVPDEWIGVYTGASATAPTSYTSYTWYQYKGDKGDTGTPATLTSWKTQYQSSTSGTVVPSGTWLGDIPSVAQGNYLWTRTTQTYNTGSPVVGYSVSRMGIDGSGSVSSVCGVSPDGTGNVTLDSNDVGALSKEGGEISGPVTVQEPTAAKNPATKQYVDDKIASINALMAYPVGSVYMSMKSTSPAEMWGGTWERIRDSVLLGASSGTHPAGSTGGSTSASLTLDNLPWSAIVDKETQGTPESPVWGVASGSQNSGWIYGPRSSDPIPVNTMPPYVAVYMWKRIA